MNNKQHTKNFAQSDDALILDQPVTGIGLKTLATMLHTSEASVMRRADELGVSLAISDVCDAAVDTRTLRCRDGLIDPLLERSLLWTIRGRSTVAGIQRHATTPCKISSGNG